MKAKIFFEPSFSLFYLLILHINALLNIQMLPQDLFPFANLGWGPSPCFPYSYEAFVIAARYFPEFGTDSPNKVGFLNCRPF